MREVQQKHTKTELTENRKKKAGWKWVRRMFWILCAAGVLCYGGLVAFVYYAETHVPPASGYDSIIVLGAQVLPDGEPSIQLRYRLDKAAEMYALNPCPVVVCGGQGGDEPAPEGEVMQVLLIEDGLPEAQVFAEISSVNTKENIRNAWDILEGLGCKKPLLITSDYHLPRALGIAADEGIYSQGAGSLCKDELGFWLKNHMREALAWVKYWGVKYVGLPL